MTRACLSLVLILILLSCPFRTRAAAQGLPTGFAYLGDVDPTIEQDIRYAGSDNFVGHPLPGYEAAECVLRIAPARALQAVQADLSAQGLGLKVYDCYRPIRAVRAMISWAMRGLADRYDERFFPRVAKGALLKDGYIGKRSTHSSGLAVDLTLVGSGNSGKVVERTGPCRGPIDDGLDMGTTFDCFDPMAQTADPGIAITARQSRLLLVAAMGRHGFSNYRREWWHFTYGHDDPGRTSLDFAITPRPVR